MTTTLALLLALLAQPGRPVVVTPSGPVKGRPPLARPAPFVPAHPRFRLAAKPPGPVPVAPADALPALQAAVDAGQALTDADGNAGATVVLPQGSYSFSGPLYIDGRNLVLKSDGGRLSGGGYMGPLLAVGVNRLGRYGLDPARYRPASALGTGRRAVATRAEVGLTVTAHPLQLGTGPNPSDPTPDYWTGPVYCWEFCVERPTTWPPSAALFGLTGDTDANPAPWDVRNGRDPGTLEFWYRTSDQPERSFRRAVFPTPGPGPWRVTVQWDGDAGTVNAWVENAAQPVSHDPPNPPRGLRLARHDGCVPFTLGPDNGGHVNDVTLHGLAVTRGRKFTTAATLTRSDGLAVNDSRFWESLNDWTGGGVQTVASLPLDDAPATHVSVTTPKGRGCGFLTPAYYTKVQPAPASRIRLEGLSLTSTVQSAVALGYCFGLTAVDCNFQGGLQGFGSVQISCSYLVTFDRCRFGGNDCGYYGWEQIARFRDTEISLTGRDGLRCHGGDFALTDTFFSFAIPAAEAYFRTVSQGYGGTLTVDGVILDNEGGGPVAALLDIDHAPYSPNAVRVSRFTASTLNAPAVFARVRGRRTAETGNLYPVGTLDLSSLCVFAGVPANVTVVQVNGAGSWTGTFDPNGLGASAVAGDTEGLTVVPQVVPAPAP